MSEVFIMQPNNDVLLMSPAYCSLDITTRVKLTNRSVGAPITGKRVISSFNFPAAEQEKSPPSQLYRKKSQTKDHPSPPKKPKPAQKPASKTQKKTEKKPEKKKPKVKEKSVSPKATQKKAAKKAAEIKGIEEQSQATFNPGQNLKNLIKASLKKEKTSKTIEEIKRKKKADKKESKKNEMFMRDVEIRLMNKRSKKVRLHHKYSWGVDQSRLKAGDPDSEKNTSRKARSTERVRAGLDTIKELNLELGRSFVQYRETSQIDQTDPPRARHASDPEVKQFMKTQKKLKKEKEDFLNMQKIAEITKRQTDLNRIIQLSKRIKQKKKSRKKKLRVKKSSEIIVQDIDLDIHDLNLVYESLRQEEVIQDSYSEPPQNTKKINILDFKTSAAVRIQSAVRGFLVRNRIFNTQDFPSSDEQVREILNQKGSQDLERDSCVSIPVTISSKHLEIFIPSNEVSSDFSSYSKNFSQCSNSEVSQKRVQSDIKDQIILREAQIQALEYIREKELKELQEVSRSNGLNNSVKKLLSEIVQRRYDQVSFLLESEFKEEEEKFFKDLATEEREEFLNELEHKRLELTNQIYSDSSLENSKGVVKNLEGDKGDEENRPVIYKPKVVERDGEIGDTVQVNVVLPTSGQHSNTLGEASVFVQDFNESEDSGIEQIDSISRPVEQPDGSLEISATSNIFEAFKSGVNNSRSPDYLPDRPSAPLYYFDRESPDTNPSPMESKYLELGPFEITPELLVDISELLIDQLISEHPVFSRVLKIDTSPEAISKYCEIIKKKHLFPQLAKDLSQPVQFRRVELIQKLQLEQISHLDVRELLNPPNLISLNVYINIENFLDSARPSFSEFLTPEELDFLIDREHIHNKAIFDANNEALNKIRQIPTGLPFPLGNNKSISYTGRAENLVQEATRLVLYWSTFEHGKIAKEEIIEGLTEEESLVQRREESLMKMIYSDITENEAQWSDYSCEEAQVKLELADYSLSILAEELIIVLNK